MVTDGAPEGPDRETAVKWDTEPDPRWMEYIASRTWTRTPPEEIQEWFTNLLDQIENGKATDRLVLTMVGQCPRCKHPISDRQEVPKKAEPFPPIVIACNCLANHDGRPADMVRGCGQAGVFKHPTGPGLVELAYLQDFSDPDDLIWEHQRQLARMKGLERTQATAEKCTATITALTGLFGLTTIITGGDAIAKVSDLPWFWLVSPKAVVLVVWVLAFSAAAFSIYWGAEAAQGIPHPPDMDEHKYRLVSVADARKAASGRGQ